MQITTSAKCPTPDCQGQATVTVTDRYLRISCDACGFYSYKEDEPEQAKGVANE
jgi:hypothetical protein